MNNPVGVTAAGTLGAFVLASKFSESWRRRVMKALIGGSENPAAEAAKAMGSRLDSIAITETSRRYSEERQAIAERIDPGVGYLLIKRWDSKLDACPVCASNNGDVVLASESFFGGEPGSVHPRCRCVAQYMRVTTFEYYAMAA